MTSTHIDVASVRSQINETLDRLAKLLPENNPDIKVLLRIKENISKLVPAMQWRFAQMIREVLVREQTGKSEAPFKVKMKNGSIITFNNLEEFDKAMKGAERGKGTPT